jgi:uncharacterized protein YukE
MTGVADILGWDGAAGHPDQVEGLAGELRQIAHSVSDIGGHLASGGFGGRWSGQAAEAFRTLLKTVPGELAKVDRSYTDAAATLSTYAGDLRQAQRAAAEVAQQIDDAQARMAAAQRAADAASHDLHTARHLHGIATDPAGKAAAKAKIDSATRAAGAANTRKAAANGDLGHASDRAKQIRAFYDDAVDVCCRGLDRASHEGIRDTPLSWLHRHVIDLNPVTQHIWKVITSPVSMLVDETKFLMHPSVDQLKKVLDDLGDELELAGAVLLVVAAVVTAPEDIAIVAAAGAVVAGLSVAQAGGELVVDAIRVGRGEDDPETLAFDAIDLGLDVITLGHAHAVSDKIANTKSLGWMKRYLRYGESGRRQGFAHTVKDHAPEVANKVARKADEALRSKLPGGQPGIVTANRPVVRARSTTVRHPVRVPAHAHR